VRCIRRLRRTSRLLGAQLIGPRSAEVAERVHTYAGAPFHTTAVDDLSQLDLSYIPPLGSPWGAVQMAAQSWVREHQLPGAPRFDRIRANALVQSFLTGAGAAVVVGAIAGASIPLGLAVAHLWQGAVHTVAAIWLLVLRKHVVTMILGAAIGVLATVAGAPISR
jgi:hypothetical protein